MDAGFQHEDPEHRTDGEIGQKPHDAEAIERDERDQAQGRPAEHRERELARIEERDDDDRAEIVEDGERRQEDLEGGRHP